MNCFIFCFLTCWLESCLSWLNGAICLFRLSPWTPYCHQYGPLCSCLMAKPKNSSMKLITSTCFGCRRSSRKPTACFQGEPKVTWEPNLGLLICLVYIFFFHPFVSFHFSSGPDSHGLCYYFRDFNAEPELMPKTPSQKKNSRRKRVSLGRQEENQARRRYDIGHSFLIFPGLSLNFSKYMFLPHPDFPREGAATCVAPPSNHWT